MKEIGRYPNRTDRRTWKGGKDLGTAGRAKDHVTMESGEGRQGTANSKQQTANSKQQTQRREKGRERSAGHGLGPRVNSTEPQPGLHRMVPSTSLGCCPAPKLHLAAQHPSLPPPTTHHPSHCASAAQMPLISRCLCKSLAQREQGSYLYEICGLWLCVLEGC